MNDHRINLSTIMAEHPAFTSSDLVTYAPRRWWRVVGPDGVMRYQAGDEERVHDMARPGDRIQRMYTATASEWRDLGGEGVAEGE